VVLLTTLVPVTRAGLDKNPRAVATMFDGVAERYDVTNDVLSLGRTRAWRKALVRAIGPREGERLLDLAAGTGTSSAPLAAAGASVVACDFSLGMLQVGRRRQTERAAAHPYSRPDGVAFVAGDALHLPFADASFDAATISFGLRNVVDVPGALLEMRRVLRPGGRLVICEFSTPTWKPFRAVYDGYLGRALPKVARRVNGEDGAYTYLAESIMAWPDQPGLATLMREAGLRRVAWHDLTGGVVALHHGVREA
jgi:demethylmenaquinone methyltransferase/2-methoxy-6-polyprenyl-1,4-benzoquinol methylase